MSKQNIRLDFKTEHEDRFKRSTGPLITAGTFFIGLIALIFLCLINFWIVRFICQIHSRLKKERCDRLQCRAVRYSDLSPTTKLLRARDCGPDYCKALKNEKKIDQDFQKIVKKYTQEKKCYKPQPEWKS